MKRILLPFTLMFVFSGIFCYASDDEFGRSKYIPVILENAGENKNARKWAETINPDGSWSKVKYADDDATTTWDPGSHCNRFRHLAVLYYKTGDKSVLEACHKAMNYWFSLHKDHREQLGYDREWYNKMLWVPRAMGPGFLLLKDEMTPDEIRDAESVMREAYGHPKATGFNKVYLAGNRIMLGALLEDKSIIEEGRDALASVIETTTEEGIQPDMSFHQHGHVLQIGTYGMGYVKGLGWFYKALKDTPFALPEKKTRILYDFIQQGMRWFSYKGYFDMSGLCRQIQRGTQKSRAREVEELVSFFDIKEEEPSGCKYFPYSDYGIYRNDTFYASIRMQSNRVKGFEYIANMNKKGWFSSDGALLVRRTGDEYFDIPPCWDWTRVPGTTAWDDGSDLTLRRASYVRPVTVRFNLTDKVFGKTVGDNYMVAAMDLNRDGLTGRKVWVFYPEGIVCLGAGITYDGKGRVRTSINQCEAKDDYLTGKGWVFQDGITYVMLEGTSYKVLQEKRQGRWTDILDKAPSALVKKEIFDLYIDHGEKPAGVSYAYVISPMGTAPGKTAKKVRAAVKVLENSVDFQKVEIGGKKFSVDWEKSSIIVE